MAKNPNFKPVYSTCSLAIAQLESALAFEIQGGTSDSRHGFILCVLHFFILCALHFFMLCAIHFFNLCALHFFYFFAHYTSLFCAHYTSLFCVHYTSLFCAHYTSLFCVHYPGYLQKYLNGIWLTCLPTWKDVRYHSRTASMRPSGSGLSGILKRDSQKTHENIKNGNNNKVCSSKTASKHKYSLEERL